MKDDKKPSGGVRPGEKKEDTKRPTATGAPKTGGGHPAPKPGKPAPPKK